MPEPLLIAENVSIAFGEVKALDDVSLSINSGEIRCLVGENGSGKSTFVKIVSGVYAPTSGRVLIAGKPLESHDPRAAIVAGVQVIYQDLSLFQHLSVVENIAINRMLHEGHRFVNRKEMRRIAVEQIERMRVNLPLDELISSLSVANRQLVAIARAMSMNAKILFMDEPTTALTTREVNRLLAIVHELKQQGLSIVFISHKLDEIFEVADTITVFRDGNHVGDFDAKDLNPAKLSYHMTGREVLYKTFHPTFQAEETAPPVLEVRNLTRKGNYQNVSFKVERGDIVGLTGLLGAGRTELALSLYGLNRPDSGEILVSGKPVQISQPWDALAYGIALVPEDRTTQGLFRSHTIKRNVSSSQLDAIVNKLGLLAPRREADVAKRTIAEMRVNNKNLDAIVGILSGGNQQKVVIGKWVQTNPSVLILDSPTVGIDIGSKSEIYEHIHRLAHDGMGVILISDEPEEIIANCNKVIVMHEGQVIASFNDSDRLQAAFTQRLASIIANPDSIMMTVSAGGE